MRRGGFPSTLQWASQGNPHHTQWEVERTEGQGAIELVLPPITPPPCKRRRVPLSPPSPLWGDVSAFQIPGAVAPSS